MSNKEPTQFEINQARMWEGKDRMIFFIKKLRGLMRESHLIKVYLVLVIIFAAAVEFMNDGWMGLVVSGFLIHVAFLYFRNLKRFHQFEIDAGPMMLEYRDYINRRADVAGVKRPFDDIPPFDKKPQE